MKMLENNPKARKASGLSKKEAKEYTSSNVGEKAFSKLKEKVKKKRG